MTQTILIRDLSKQYRIGASQGQRTLRETLTDLVRRPFHGWHEQDATLWALKDVSFGVEGGEVVGIIGRNGAGKSTLLKVLSKITYPTSGSVKVKGRAASLLEVGTGFHSELTGRENIYLNGSILGMRKKEIDSKLEAIIEFAGVEKFIDTPIKHYSSGMELRLGFSVAAHLDADVLFVDEVLAVGDSEFQKKCLRAMDEMRGGGRTVLFVSHNMAAVENLCSRSIWIDQGQIKKDGPAKEVIAAYLSTFKTVQQEGFDLRRVQSRRGTGEARFTCFEILNLYGQPKTLICTGDVILVRLHYHAEQWVHNPHFGVEIYTDMGTLVCSLNTWSSGYEIGALSPGDGRIDLQVNSLNLIPGQYYFSLWLASVGPKHYDQVDYCARMDVEPADFYQTGKGMDRKFGIVLFPCSWEVSRMEKKEELKSVNVGPVAS